MAETFFFRNLNNINSLKINTNRKILNNLIKDKYNIIATVELNELEFKEFCLNLRNNYKFLYEYIEQMYIDSCGIWRCIAVKNGEKKILVQSNGYSYPRFTGLVLENIDLF